MAVISLTFKGFGYPAPARRQGTTAATVPVGKQYSEHQENYEGVAIRFHAEDAWISACRDPFERSMR
jgi:hypothetical protein